MFMSSTSLVLIAIALLVISRMIYKAGYKQGKRDEQMRLYEARVIRPMDFQAPD